MNKNKRKNERYSSKLFVNIESNSNDFLGRGVVLDVSLSGFGIETEAELEMNGEYICHLEVPLTIRAKVTRSHISGQIKHYGVRFMDQGLLDKILFKKILKGPRKTGRIDD